VEKGHHEHGTIRKRELVGSFDIHCSMSEHLLRRSTLGSQYSPIVLVRLRWVRGTCNGQSYALSDEESISRTTLGLEVVPLNTG